MFSGVFLLVIFLHNSDADIQITGAQMVVEQVKVLKCRCDLNSGFRGRIATFHDWKQVYVDSTGSEYVISHVSLKNAFDTVFSMELQRFDNNTDIYTSYTVYDVSEGYRYVDARVVHCAGANRKVINLVDDGYYQYQIDRTLLYDSTPVKFQCEVNDPTVLTITVAWISNTENRIFTFNESVVSPELTVEHDGSMFCCIYYTYTKSNNMVILQRFVKNITLLVYHKRRENTGLQSGRRTSQNPRYTNKTQQNSGKTNEASQKSGNTDKTQQNSGKINELDKNTNTKDESNKKFDNEGRTEADNPKNGYSRIIIISSISAVMAVVLISIFAIKTSCWKKYGQSQRPRPPMPLPPTQPAPYTPFYENVALRGDCELQTQEEPHYEEVIYH